MLSTGQKIVTGVLGGVSVPGWVLRGADGTPAFFDSDAANTRFWYNTTAYSSETPFLTSAGGITSSAARVYGAWVSPTATNLVPNPTFPDTTSWSATNGSIAAVAGQLQLTGGGVTQASASAALTLDATAAYQVDCNVVRGAGPGITMGLSGIATLGSFFKSVGPVSTQAISFLYGAIQTAYFTGIRQNGVSAGISILDSPKVRQAFPFSRSTVAVISGRISFTLPSSFAGDQVIFQADSDDEVNRIRLVYVNATGHLNLITTYNSVAKATIDLGAVTTSTAYYVDFFASAAPAAFTWASLSGAAVIQNANGGAWGLAKFRTGRSFTGDTFTGTVSRATLFDGENVAKSTYIWGEGDSYVAGAADTTSLTKSLQANTVARMFYTAVGGTTLANELTRVQAHPKLAGNAFIIWDGDANGFDTLANDMARYASIVAALGHSRYVIIPPCRRNNATAGQNAATLALQVAIASTYPNNYYDAQAFLATLAVSPGDDADVAAGYIPTSCLQGDLVHLLSAKMDLVAADFWTAKKATLGF
ncbi:hypothetical protein ACVWZK_006390 [Bradyrhizobium sp. GM0.4]